MEAIAEDQVLRACIAATGAELLVRPFIDGQVECGKLPDGKESFLGDVQCTIAATARVAEVAYRAPLEAPAIDLVLQTLTRLNAAAWRRVSPNIQEQILLMDVLELSLIAQGQHRQAAIVDDQARAAGHEDLASQAARLALRLTGNQTIPAIHALIGLALRSVRHAGRQTSTWKSGLC